jgi:glycosyltransferase involved in cell wall biosynthesis
MSRDRIFLGYDSVDNDYFERETTRLRQINKTHPDHPPRPYWLVVTRMIPRKNLTLLVDAYAGYRQEVGAEYAWDLVICGSGTEEKNLKGKTEKLGIEGHVHFPGFKTYQEIPHWYAFAQAFIHPALQEQWGLVVNEACASGLPVICSQTIGAKELVLEGVNGFQFNPTSVSSLINTLTRFHRLSIEERHQMGFQSRKIVEGYHPDRFARGLRDCAKRCL